MKNSFFLKMLMFMLGIAMFGVDGGEGGGAGGSDDPGEGNPGDKKPDVIDPPNPADKDKPSDKEAALLKELMEKKTSLKDAKSQLEQLKEKLNQFDGINVDEVKTLLKERQEAETKELEKKGEWDRLKANLVEQYEAAKAALEGRINELQAELANKDSSINGLTVGSAFSASKFIAEEMTLTPAKAQIIYGPHFEFVDGKMVGYDKPKGSASRTQLIDAQGEPLSFEAALMKLVDLDVDKDHLIRSKAKPGANSGGDDKSAGDIGSKTVFGTSRISAALAKKK